MKRQNRRKFGLAAILLAVFIMWTVAVTLVDVQTIGPGGSPVGFATLNGFVHRLTGVHMQLYHITDWLGLVPVGVGFAFAILGLTQWIRRKSIFKVDRSLLLLGVFYILTVAAYLFFERVVINYRPVLIQGFLEASYPSSTTLLVLCVMPTAMLQLRHRIQNPRLRRWVTAVVTAFMAFMVIGRLLSGVHWFTDIVGGILLASGLVMLYKAALE